MPYNFFPHSFHKVVTAEALRAKIDRHRRFCNNAVTLIKNFRYKGSPPRIIFARLVRPMNALVRWKRHFQVNKPLRIWYRSKSYLQILKTTEYQLSNDVTVTCFYCVKNPVYFMKKNLLYKFSYDGYELGLGYRRIVSKFSDKEWNLRSAN